MTQFALPLPPKSLSHTAARPMLARDADSMYWMSRYVERAEHVARLLLVNSNLLMDVGELAPTLQQRQWQSVLTVFRLEAPPPAPEGPSAAAASGPALGARVAQHMVFDRDNPNSLINCITRARENARAIRENISAEMWESLNTVYWSMRGDEARARFDESPDDFYRQVMLASMLFQGLTDQTQPHDQGWQFTQLGKYLERVDVTCRIIETKFSILKSADNLLAGAMRNIHWMAVLRSCCSIEAYRRQHIGDMDPLKVASYLILDPTFPRSIRFGVNAAHEAISAIRAEVNPLAIDPAERVLGRLNTQLEYSELNEILSEGLPAYLTKIQTLVGEAGFAVQTAYFLH
jgi:uncharacterized alpha-E superfamily protein